MRDLLPRPAPAQLPRRAPARWRALVAAAAAITLGALALPARAQQPVALASAPSSPLAKPYANDQLASQAIRLEETLRKETRGLTRGKTAQQLLDEAAAAGKAQDARAIELAAGAIALDPGRALPWGAYAMLIKRGPLPDDQTYILRERATTAAYAAYRRVSGAKDKAQALALLSDTYAAREMWRPALDAAAASLALFEDAGLRARYATMRAEHGFRVSDYTVDSDAVAPRVCFEFSEPLARRADFSPYVAQAGAAATGLTVEERQICVDGLKHGESYKFTLRRGLPSSVGENLLADVNYDVYVRDRSPQARFTGKNYVLPTVGQEGLPVVTVNASHVSIDLYRIGERSLAATLRGEDFMKQISGWRAGKIAEEEGRKVWSGTLDTQSDLNKDVTTAFPVLQAVEKLEPGVYVMTARVKGGGDEDYSQRATQWFIVSDLGLTALSGPKGVTLVARSLASASPKAGVEVKLIARDNEVLGTAKTDADGVAHFDPGLARGTGGQAPGVLVATDGADSAFLDMGAAPFDFTDRGVEGRVAPKGLDAMVYAERGVYRPGESVFLTALLRDAKGVAAPGLPLTLVVQRPDGVEFSRQTLADQGAGGRALTVSLLGDAPTGSWKALAYADPKGKPIGETTFLVEDYMPERLDVKVTSEEASLPEGGSATLDVSADYLYGAPGAGLEIAGEARVKAVEGGALAGFPGYVAGVTDEAFDTVTNELVGAPKTDAKGRARVVVALPPASALRPLEAEIALRVGEAGGRAVERVVTLPIRASAGAIGVKKNFTSLSEGANATFDVIAVSPDGARLASPHAAWTLLRLQTRYQWLKSDGSWGFEPVTTTTKVAGGALDIPAGEAAHLSAPVEYGGYRLDVKGADGVVTSVAFEVGWSGEASAQAPDLLPVTLDKKSYRAGEVAKLTIESRAAGQGFLAIVADGVEEMLPVALKAGATTLDLPVKAEWGAGAYALASAHRPLDAGAKRMPGRAVGLAWFAIDPQARKLDVKIETPEKVRPRGPLAIPVSLGGLAPGEEAYVTISAVDVGILNLTDYDTPAPFDYFFGQRQIATEMRDLYGYLIDGMQGARGAIRSGGDGGGPGLEGNRPTQEPLARYSGVLKADAQGRVAATFDLPAFNGTVRVAAVAWSKTRAGSAEADVIVRDPVVAQATLPRFLSIGDRSRLHLRFDNVEGEGAALLAKVDLRGPIAAPADALETKLDLPKGKSTSLEIPVTATGVGRAEVEVTLSGGGVSLAQTLALDVEAGTADLQRRDVRTLGPGESATISSDLLADMLPGTGAVTASLSPFGAIDAAALLAALDRYPYGCTEQTVSRALPLLYVNQLAPLARAAIDGDVGARVRGAVERVLSRQSANGAFGLWSAGGDEDNWLDAYTLDFLTRAREQGYDVPQRVMDLGLDRLRNYAANVSDADRADGAALAYSLYVLARNGRPVAGDLRYLADARRSDFKTALGRAQIGAALALIGDRQRADAALADAVSMLARSGAQKSSRPDYGSPLRDGAGAVALIAETGVGGADLLRRADLVVGELQQRQSAASTQEKGWLVMAAQAMAKAADGFSWQVEGRAGSENGKGAFARRWSEAGLAAPVTIVNRGGAPARLVVTTSGNPIVPEPAAAQGYDVSRAYYRLDGSPVQGEAKQNERLVVVLKVTEREAMRAKLLLVDRLPAGLEIDNPKLVASGSLDGLPWFKQEIDPAHAEYRDDRFVAAFDRDGSERASFSVAYVVRAVTPGRYVAPPALIEDMYRPERFGRAAFGAFEVKAP